MLKGTTKIELTDVATGETEVIEKHNTITGALQEIFNPTLGHLTSEATLLSNLPAYTTLLGGLLLFDGRIEGDPLPLCAPDNVKLVGCARYNYANTLGTIYMGSYDVNESVLSPQDKMAKLVYNFTQSQGNGTINSICLTHRNGGAGVYRSDFTFKSLATRLANTVYASPTNKITRNSRDRSVSFTAYGTNEYLFLVDVDNDVAYYFRATAANTLVIVKRRMGLKQFSVFGNNADIISETTINLTTNLNTTNNTYNFDQDDNALYIMSASSATVNAGGSFTVTKIMLNGTGATQYTLTNKHTAAVYITTGYVHRGKLYMTTGGTSTTMNGKTVYNYRVVRHPLDGGAATTHGNVSNSGTSVAIPRPMYAADGRMFWQGYFDTPSGAGGLQVTDGNATPDDSNTTTCGVDVLEYSPVNSSNYPVTCTQVLNHPMLQYLSAHNSGGGIFTEGFYFLSHYLGTVNNLATPIVKAPTQTMKITYTIQILVVNSLRFFFPTQHICPPSCSSLWH